MLGLKTYRACPLCAGRVGGWWHTFGHVLRHHFVQELLRGDLTRLVWRDSSRTWRVFMVVWILLCLGLCAAVFLIVSSAAGRG